MKQHGIAFVIAGGVAVLAHELGPRPVRWSTVLKRGGLFGAAVLTPLLLTLGALAATGVFENFRFWVLDYAPTYGSHHTWAHAWSLLRAVSARIFLGAPALWVLSGVGLVAAVFIREVRQRRWFAVPFLGMSVLAVCPGLVFRAHYFVLMLPVASVLFGIAVGAFVRRFREGPVATAVVLGIAASSLAITVDQQGSLWYVTDPEAVSRELFVQNPFAESLVFADYIRDHSEPGATVAVVGSEPQIPFYARRRSATAYIYMYPLMEDQPYAADMQRAAIREIEIAEPQYAVYVVNQMSWLINRKSSTWIVDWFNRYRIAHYRVVGVAVSQVERDSGKFLAPRYYWGEDAERIAARVLSLQKEAFQRTVPPGIVLFERRP